MNAFKNIKDFYTYSSFVEKETERINSNESENTEGDLRFDYKEYSQLNLKRMQRWDKTYKPSEEIINRLNNINQKQIWWVITELWCGDSAQILPIIAKIANATDKIDLRIILRDDNIEIMDQYLTNGGRSIPKLIAIDTESNKELFTWGPRPKDAQDLVDTIKKDPSKTQEDMINALYAWYPKDKGMSTEREIAVLLNNK